MFDLDKWQEIYETVNKNKLRTFLTGFSVAWGIFMLIILLGSGYGLENGVKKEFEGDAVNYLSINGGVTSKPYKGMKPGRFIQMENAEEEMLSVLSNVDKSSNRTRLWQINTISYKNQYGTFDVFAVSPDYSEVERLVMTSGRFLNQIDMTETRKVVALGRLVYEELFKGAEALEKYVNIGGVPFKVIGVFNDPGNDRDLERVYIPTSAGQRVFGMGENLNSIQLMLGNASVEESQQTVDEVKAAMSEKFKFDPTDNRALFIWNSIEELSTVHGFVCQHTLVHLVYRNRYHYSGYSWSKQYNDDRS
jgi:putative ABC transport system permease protein